jgi:hypothetical protein
MAFLLIATVGLIGIYATMCLAYILKLSDVKPSLSPPGADRRKPTLSLTYRRSNQ